MSTNLIADLEQFTREMAKYDERQVIKERPTVPSLEVMTLRVSLIEEEVHETLDAMHYLQENAPEGISAEGCQEAFAEIADGIADSIVVLIGTALAYGIPLQKVWDEVHRANMDKVTSRCICNGHKVGELRDENCVHCDGSGRIPFTPRVREDGKILKPDGWRPPQVQQIIEEAMSNAK